MALVQYRFEIKGVEITKRMHAPKVSTIKAWYKGARQVIPELPSLKDTDWFISSEQATIKWIRIDISNSVGERAYLVIDRSVPSIG